MTRQLIEALSSMVLGLGGDDRASVSITRDATPEQLAFFEHELGGRVFERTSNHPGYVARSVVAVINGVAIEVHQERAALKGAA